jgi:hypothetical protein
MTPAIQANKPLTVVIGELFQDVIQETNMHAVGERLRDIATEHGLGVALLVAWQHGLQIGHIPLDRHKETTVALDEQAKRLTADPYAFVHVGIRWMRNKNRELVNAKILNKRADPMWFFYHEDALVSQHSFDPIKLQALGLPKPQDDINRILEVLAAQQILVKANLNNRQIQFKDLDSKRFLETSSAEVYVLVEDDLENKSFWLPSFGLDADHTKAFREHIVKALRNRRPCNYCSVQALNPREATIHSRHLASVFKPKAVGPSTRRNYQFGFTFAPFGDPREVCHFLAWDFPHISDTVLNMDPQDYSLADLIELVSVINADVTRFAERYGAVAFGPIAGVCNHWAGNSIYHQHYQFFAIPGLPLLNSLAQNTKLAECGGVSVSRLRWEAPAYLITSDGSASTSQIGVIAERVASEWASLNGAGDYDTSMGNGIKIRHHTQNTYVTLSGGSLVAVFVPRHRANLGTQSQANKVQKRAAGVLEMMGYFLVDDLAEFAEIERWGVAERAFLAASWLRELSPDGAKIRQFEANLHTHLSGLVVVYLQSLDVCVQQRNENCLCSLRSEVENDCLLEDSQKAYLRERISAEYNRLAGRSVM